ncbi:phytoene desaturase family protein [Paenibacillus hexagrammi]|uniref:NAD(P)/FAD-dependent oxidoreductase n=1 Tax=Paenibacillus hexagrammi TaxID=2908839 RepID=A0ABY3SPX7_9BACL|nr:NAD(P)/FAD-dependent oxidoreductase [Paenibacillus sp. YPD9-1]UJF35445.1 NAD(P)/FAD-dependent oxidoreductase [Paenibacillus sp. YPD9-1]
MIQNTQNSNWDVVIIGAGIAGLTASIYLARAGRRVLVLEKGDQWGGRAVSTELAASRVNLGAHALNKSALPILQEVGVIPAGASPKPFNSLTFTEANGGFKELPLSQCLLGSFLKWQEKLQLMRFYSSLKKIDTSALNELSFQTYIDNQLDSPRVRSIVHALVRLSTYSHDPELLSAGAAIEQLKLGQVLYIHGGWQALVNSLIEQAHRAGVVIQKSSPVREITGSYPQMNVGLKDGMQITTRHVLSTAGPKDTMAMLQPALTSAEAEAYNKLIPVRAACLDLVVSGMPLPKKNFVLGVDEPWYYSNHSAASSLSDHPGYSVVHVMKYLSSSTPSEPKQDELELEGFLDRIQPGWRKHVIQQRFLPRMLVSHGIVTAASGGLSGRPGPAVEGRPGLYVAGDWVGSTGMLLQASLASAKEAAQTMLR